MSIFEDIAGAFVLLTGLYISWYWYSSITDHFNDRVLTNVGGVQQRLSVFVQNHQSAIVLTAAAVIALAIISAVILSRRQTATPP